jgi:hypothetical protein
MDVPPIADELTFGVIHRQAELLLLRIRETLVKLCRQGVALAFSAARRLPADVIADRLADAPAAWIQLRRVSLFIAHLLVDKYKVSGCYIVVFLSGFPFWVFPDPPSVYQPASVCWSVENGPSERGPAHRGHRNPVSPAREKNSDFIRALGLQTAFLGLLVDL